MASEEANARPSGSATVHAVLFSVAVLFSLNYLFGKIALRTFQPLAMAWVRVCGSALLLSLFARIDQKKWPLTAVAEKRSLVLYSLLGVVFNQLLFISGLSLTSAHEAAILITTIPVFTLLGAILLKREQASFWRFAGIGIAAAGALTIIGFQGLAGTHNSLLGDVMILLNCLSFGTYLVVSRPIMSRYPASVIIASIFVIAVPLMLPFCLTSLVRQDWGGISLQSWLALGAMIVGPTVVAYQLNGWALARAESSTVAAYTYLQPFLASILAAIVLKETIERTTVISGSIICIGVALATRKTRQMAEIDQPV